MDHISLPRETFPGWETCDTWSSVFYALAATNGDDPLTAAARHREWCVRMGYEPAAVNDNPSNI